jgi:hypothetical protein
MPGQRQTPERAVCALEKEQVFMSTSLHFANAPPSQPIQRGKLRPRQQPSRANGQSVTGLTASSLPAGGGPVRFDLLL